MIFAGTNLVGGATFSWVTVCLSFLVLVVFVTMLAKRAKFVYALRHIPSPWAVPFIGNAVQLNCTQEEFFYKLFNWGKQYGDIFLLWVGLRPFIFLYRVESVQPVLSSNLHIDKSLEYYFMKPWLGSGLVTSSGDKWQRHRKLLTPSFHNGMIEQYLDSTIREANTFVAMLETKELGKVFDVVPYAKLAALDVICDTAMGYHINAQSQSQHEYVLAVDRITSIVQKRFITFWMHSDIIFDRTSSGKEHEKALKTIHDFTDQVIRDRKAEWKLKRDGNDNETPRTPRALLDLLLQISENGTILSDADIRDEVNTFMFAGHDTVATSISWILYSLGRHPEHQANIVNEFYRVVGSNNITIENLNKLEYLEACINESWRLYPVVPLIARQIYKPINIMGSDVPSGSTVLVNTYLLHRDSRHFEHPNEFRPERFLPPHPKPQIYTFVPFSAGSRNCIGRKFAIMEVKVMIITILKAFHVHAVDTEEQLRLSAELVLLNTNGIRLTITPRIYEHVPN